MIGHFVETPKRTTGLHEYMSKAGLIIREFPVQLADFENNLLPSYLTWLENFMDKDIKRKSLICATSDLKYGDIIFSSKIGFNAVKKVTQDDLRFKLHLSRPGYPVIGGEFALKQVQLGMKSIKFIGAPN